MAARRIPPRRGAGAVTCAVSGRREVPLARKAEGWMDNHRDDAADVLVIFGITGDLARG